MDKKNILLLSVARVVFFSKRLIPSCVSLPKQSRISDSNIDSILFEEYLRACHLSMRKGLCWDHKSEDRRSIIVITI